MTIVIPINPMTAFDRGMFIGVAITLFSMAFAWGLIFGLPWILSRKP